MKRLSVIFAVCGLLLVPSFLWAEGSSIRGVVTDSKGKPVAKAQIRAERTNGNAKPAVAITDAKGQYALNHLELGTYKVIAWVQRTPRSAASVNTSKAGWVKVDFVLKDSFAVPQRRDQSATDRVQGQDLRRMQMDQAGFGAMRAPGM